MVKIGAHGPDRTIAFKRKKQWGRNDVDLETSKTQFGRKCVRIAAGVLARMPPIRTKSMLILPLTGGAAFLGKGESSGRCSCFDPQSTKKASADSRLGSEKMFVTIRTKSAGHRTSPTEFSRRSRP